MIAVVGGGITGLTLAWLLKEKGVPVQLYEASKRVGGNIKSVREAECLLEVGPNSLRLNDFLHAYFTRLQLADDLVQATPEARHRYVLRDGAYRRLPTGPISLLFNRFFRFSEKRRILRERNVPPGTDETESIDAFFRRRFGDAVADYAVAPFISGIYAGNPHSLAVRAAFPQMKKWEQEHGSVIRGAIRGRKRNRHKGVISLREGLEMLPRRLAERLGDRMHLEKPVTALTADGSGYTLHFAHETVAAEKVVLTVPAQVTAKLLHDMDPAAAQALGSIYYPPVAMVHSLYRREDVGHPLDGFGGLNNHREGRKTLGTIFSSTTFAGRAPQDTALLTTFVGGAYRPENARRAPEAIQQMVHDELQDLLSVSGGPLFQKCTVWPQAIPQYENRIWPAWQAAERWATRGLYLSGNWIGGISVVACIEQAHHLCEQLTASHG